MAANHVAANPYVCWLRVCTVSKHQVVRCDRIRAPISLCYLYPCLHVRPASAHSSRTHIVQLFEVSPSDVSSHYTDRQSIVFVSSGRRWCFLLPEGLSSFLLSVRLGLLRSKRARTKAPVFRFAIGAAYRRSEMGARGRGAGRGLPWPCHCSLPLVAVGEPDGHWARPQRQCCPGKWPPST